MTKRNRRSALLFMIFSISLMTSTLRSQSSTVYRTNFPVPENPISEGGRWTNGKTGGWWNNVRTVPGEAYGADYATEYNDPIAILNNPVFSPNQYSQGTVYRAPGYSPGVPHEIELLLRFQITTNNARGYEVLWGHAGNLAIIRWNGQLGDYSVLLDIAPGPAVDGDLLRAEINGSVIRVYRNGTLIGSASDSTWANGQPGIGFWPKPGATPSAYGWSSYEAGDLGSGTSDTTAPTISGVNSSGVTNSSASINWTTNEAADSQVEYGPSTSYGSSTPIDTNRVTSHSMTLGGLLSGTTYHFRVKSRDAAGNLATSGDFAFTTTSGSGGGGFTTHIDFQPPGATYSGYLVDSGAAFGNRGNGYTYGWSHPVDYRARNNALSPDQRYDGFAIMGNETWEIIVPSGSYSVHAVVGDADWADVVSKLTVEGVMAIDGQTTSANRWLEGTVTVSVGDGRLTVTNLAGSYNKICYIDISSVGSTDNNPPVISGVDAGNATRNAAMISWATDEPANTQVEYGVTTAYGSQTTLNTSMVTSHSQGVSGLNPSTTYNYRVKSRDSAGNLGVSSNFTFTTAAAPDSTPPTISGVTSSNVTSSSARITWSTDEAADSQVQYGTSAFGTSTPLDASLVTSHSMTLSGLSPATTYYFRVLSKDASGNLATSGDFGFTTPGGSAFVAHVNFQPAGATYSGYVADSGDPLANRGNGLTYGWTNVVGTRARNNAMSPDQRYDTFAIMGNEAWEIVVPNGNYVVHVAVGDSDWADVVSKLTVEGVSAINGQTNSSNRWLEGTVTVTVSDGRLTVTNLAGSYNKICYIDITAM